MYGNLILEIFFLIYKRSNIEGIFNGIFKKHNLKVSYVYIKESLCTTLNMSFFVGGGHDGV